MKNIRLIPKIRFTNYRKEFPNISSDAFQTPFRINRYWRNRIIEIHIKHYSVSFDFRKNWVLDMMEN